MAYGRSAWTVRRVVNRALRIDDPTLVRQRTVINALPRWLSDVAKMNT
ncbi:MAG: hypothetical protein U0163_14425 [Gemmatimonadaceae bacterium]